MSLTADQIEAVAEALWLRLADYSEAKYLLSGDENHYKPYYRASTILAMSNPPHFQVLGEEGRRHLTREEAEAVLLASHPHFQSMDQRSKDHFWELYEEFSGPGFWDGPDSWGE